MTNQITELQIISKLGTFKFKKQYETPAQMYKALCDFESDNWEMLGDVSYKVFKLWSDGEKTHDTYSGMNASAHLACEFDDEHASEMDAYYHSQY